MANKVAHLQMIQAVVARLAGQSLLLRGWAVTLVSAILFFSVKDANAAAMRVVVAICPLPLASFMVLDIFFLARERQFRQLHDEVRQLPEDRIDFSMTVAPVTFRSRASAGLSIFVWLFYAVVFIVLGGVTVLLR